MGVRKRQRIAAALQQIRPGVRHRIAERIARNIQAPDLKARQGAAAALIVRSEEHTSELQSLMRISYAVFSLKKKKKKKIKANNSHINNYQNNKHKNNKPMIKNKCILSIKNKTT